MWPSILSGLLLGIAFPLRIGQWELPNCGWLAWIGLVPLFYSIRMASPGQAFRRTFVAAFIYYSLSLYWLYTAMHTFGHLSPAVSMGVLLLTVMILAAYISVAPCITRWVARRFEVEPLWLLPAAWVACDLARNYGPCGGFPWGNLAQTQYAYLPIIQIVDVVGIYGLTFAIVWTNRWLAHAWARVRGDAWTWGERRTWVTVGLWLFIAIYGTGRFVAVNQQVARWPSYTVALLQGNIPQEDKWRPGLEEEQLRTYQSLISTLGNEARSTKHEARGIDLIIWPEASYPWALSVASRQLPVASDSARNAGDRRPATGDYPTLLGGLAAEGEGPDRRLFNSVFAITPDARIVGRYDKTHLVPFGEYVPYQDLFFFARRLAAPIGDYAQGERIVPLKIGSVAVGPLVCYEDIFPEIARAHARQGAHFFANLTNDAWYGWSAAAKQHLTLSTFRAVEHRRYLVRATNTGVSAIIDPLGRPIITGRLFEPAVIVGRIRLGAGETLYTRFGDWFAWTCVLAMISAVVVAQRRNRS